MRRLRNAWSRGVDGKVGEGSSNEGLWPANDYLGEERECGWHRGRKTLKLDERECKDRSEAKVLWWWIEGSAVPVVFIPGSTSARTTRYLEHLHSSCIHQTIVCFRLAIESARKSWLWEK